MNEKAIKFITLIVKPWESLNAALSQPYAVQPGISDFTLMATSLATSIKHFAEVNGLSIRDLELKSQPYKVMSDVADASKHGDLRDKNRNNSLVVSSMFEGNGEARFRFLRNVITVEHKSFGKIDFLECSKEAALFLQNESQIRTSWTPKIYAGAKEFSAEVRLHASAKPQVAWGSLAIHFVKRDENGILKPFDPPQWKFHLTSDF